MSRASIQAEPSDAGSNQFAPEAYIVGRFGGMAEWWLDAVHVWLAVESKYGVRHPSNRPPNVQSFLRAVDSIVKHGSADAVSAVRITKATMALRNDLRRLWTDVTLRGVGSGLPMLGRSWNRARKIKESTVGLFWNSPTLRRWHRLGAALAACRQDHQLVEENRQELAALYRELRGSAENLHGQSDYQSVTDATSLNPGETPLTLLTQLESSRHRHLTLARADAAILAELRGRAVAPPVLVITGARIQYRGRSCAATSIPDTERAILTVLAVNANEWVSREKIRRDADIVTDDEGMPPVVSRLRTLLRTHLTPELGPNDQPWRRLIVGARGRPFQINGPYSLRMEPSLVVVQPAPDPL